MKASRIALGLALALMAGGASSTPAGVMDDLMKKLENAPREVLFPDPQDQALTRIRFLPDQLIYLFREAQSHRLAASGDHLEQMLFEAVALKHQAHCWKLTKQLRRELDQGKGKQLDHLREILGEIQIPEDFGAFAPVFQRLPGELPSELQGFAEQAEQAVATLEDAARLGLYCQASAADADFYAKRRVLGRLWDKARKGMGGLLDRLETRFSQENLVRFFTRLSQSRFSEEIKAKAHQARSELAGRLVEEVLEDLDDQVEGGLGEGIQSIERVGGFLQTKSILMRGRLRILVKLMQELKDQPQELSLFLGPLKEIHRGVRQRCTRSDLDAAGKAYLEKLDQTLDNTELFLGMAAKKPASEPTGIRPENLWRAVYEALTAEDFEGLFAEMKAHPESF